MSTTPQSTYDVIIVGGRPAGASLAARLGARGFSVLVVDKASFPSQPEVPSCPIMYQASMRLLDEIGITEDRYAASATRVTTGVLGVEGIFQAVMHVPEMFGRSYICGFDRAAFDEVLWRHLAKYPSVSTREQFTVSELVRGEAGRVVGIEGSERGGPKETFGATLCVVGADGRHSFVARKVGAPIVEDCSERTSTIHFAQWEDLAPCDAAPDPVVQLISNGRGKNILFFPSMNGRVGISTHVRTDRADTKGDAQNYYLSLLRSFPTVLRRLEGARQVGPLLGIRRIANRYLAHGGPGWVLVGDALHHKDPVDGQGIYDALIEAKRLAEILTQVRDRALPWTQALADYQRAVAQETGGMFQESMKRLERELYSEFPTPVIRTLLRWLMQDPEYQRRFLYFLGRVIPPENWLTPSLALGAMARGAKRDLDRLLGRAT
jgi:2-polyprenyl-6-methoxyphenol hydroxylase-like FAD-dependent oxidoreductase